MAKKTTSIRRGVSRRNWLAYVCEALVTSGAMPTWEAATYLTENLFGAKPNPRLLTPVNSYEATAQFLHCLYQPIFESVSREVILSPAATLHLFTDISLTGNSAVLIVFLPGKHKPAHLLILDAVKAWDLVFPDTESFNVWVEERYHKLVQALRSVQEEFDRGLQKAGS